MSVLGQIYSKEEWHSLVLNNREYAEKLVTGNAKPDIKPKVIVVERTTTETVEIVRSPPKFRKENPYSGLTFREYSDMVWKITNEQPLHLLPNFKKRGFRDHHVDHRISIWLGWKSSIDPTVIGDFTNLKMIPAKENLAKGRNGKG